MPYENEFAEYRSVRRLTENERVQNLLRRSKERGEKQDDPLLPTLTYSDIQPSQWKPELVLAIDGSYQQVLVEKGYPGAEIGYVTVASVLMDINKIRKLDEQRPVDPKSFRETENTSSIESVFPGCNIVIDNELSPVASLRKTLYETFLETKIFSDGETLLETYEVLLSYKSVDSLKCPHGDNCQSSNNKVSVKNGLHSCECRQKIALYSTDGLRIHEGMVPDSANGTMFMEIMQTFERILIIHILRWFEQKELLWLLKDMAIVVDGPLALFGDPAGLLLPVTKEIRRINEKTKKYTGGVDLLLVGVEKSGFFVNHFERIDQSKDGNNEKFLPQTVLLLNDEYIKKNIVFSDSKKRYGEQTYFGRKFFYKTASGARIVASIPFLEDFHQETNLAEPKQYPRLADALAIFDQLASSRFENAISPLISANAEAAIPMNLGARVLEEMAKRLIKDKQK
ncbi:MAG: DNA double-strand break repair nuclease NurA [Chloroflexi bacterium]|nr:DNA double-strand break repair nuclease NurA [Chloroflexota bacterium]